MSLKLLLVLNPENRSDLRTETTVVKGDRVFMRIFVINDGPDPIAFDHLSVEIYANYNNDVLALAPSDCPHAGDLAGLSTDSKCSVSMAAAIPGGLKDDADPGNGSELVLVQTMMPGSQIAGFRLGTGKAGIFTSGAPFVVNPSVMVHVADGRTRESGMIGSNPESTPVIALGFATLKGLPLTVVPATATARVIEKTNG